MKPSATQISRYVSPTAYFPLLGSCLFIGFHCWALIPMYSFVDFQVDWPKLLFKSRLQIPGRDIIHVATSISRRDISSSLCSFELVVHDVATSISCRDISSSILQDSNGCFGCRDINLLSRHHLNELQLSTDFFYCRDINPFSRHNFMPL